MDSTFRGWSAARVRLVGWFSFFALALDLHGRLRVVRTMFIPGALHGIEASFLADTSLRKLRASILKVVWSCRQPLANTGAVLSLLDGPSGCDPAFCVVWFLFRMLRRHSARRPGEVHRVPSLPVLGSLAGPVQQFRAAVLGSLEERGIRRLVLAAP